MSFRRLKVLNIFLAFSLTLGMVPEFVWAGIFNWSSGTKAAVNGVDDAARATGKAGLNAVEKLKLARSSLDEFRKVIGNDPISKDSKGLFYDVHYLISSDDYSFLPTIARNADVDTLASTVAAADGGVILTGKQGVGRETLFMELVRKIRAGEVKQLPESPAIGVNTDNQLFKDRSQFHQYAVDLAKAVGKKHPGDSPVLIKINRIDDSLVDAESRTHGDIRLNEYLEDLRQAFAPRPVRVVMISSESQARKIMALPGMTKEFVTYELSQLDKIDVKTVLKNFIGKNSPAGIKTSDELIDKIIFWSGIYHADEALPGSAINLWKLAVSRKLRDIDNPQSAILESLDRELRQYKERLAKAERLLNQHGEKASYAFKEVERLNRKIDKLTNPQTGLITLEQKALNDRRNFRSAYESLVADAKRARETKNEKLARQKLAEAEELQEKALTLSETDIAFDIAQRKHLKTAEVLTPGSPMTYDEAVKFLDANYYGQPELKELAMQIFNQLRKVREDPTTPVAIIWITGPPGNGKTEYAIMLNQIGYGKSPDKLLRVNMGKLKSPHDVDTMTGPPPGLVGHDDVVFVDEVAKDNKRVILLDEIEKAHASFQDLLLQMGDPARLERKTGNVTADLTPSVIVITSNAIQETGLSDAQLRKKLIEGVVTNTPEGPKHFSVRPEIVRRITRFVNTENLDDTALTQVARKAIRQYNSKEIGGSWVELELSPEAEQVLLQTFTNEGRLGNGGGIINLIKREITSRFDDALAGSGYHDSRGWIIKPKITEGTTYVVKYNSESGFYFEPKTVSQIMNEAM